MQGFAKPNTKVYLQFCGVFWDQFRQITTPKRKSSETYVRPNYVPLWGPRFDIKINFLHIFTMQISQVKLYIKIIDQISCPQYN